MKHKGDKDKKPRKRRSNNAVIIENDLKKTIPDTSLLTEFERYLNFRLKFLKRLEDGRLHRFNELIGSHIVQMVAEGVIIRFGGFFQITENGKKAITNA